MKTTVDLPESLLKQAKHKALQNNTSLRALMISGLKKELASSMKVVSDPIEQIRNAGKKLWRGVKADRYVHELRKNWKYCAFSGTRICSCIYGKDRSAPARWKR
jgi:hypothetical protein